MDEDTQVEPVIVEIDPGSEPISGQVRRGAASEPFHGWLGLMSAVELLHAGAADSQTRRGT